MTMKPVSRKTRSCLFIRPLHSLLTVAIFLASLAFFESCVLRDKSDAETSVWPPPPVLYMHSRPLEGPIPEDINQLAAKHWKKDRLPQYDQIAIAFLSPDPCESKTADPEFTVIVSSVSLYPFNHIGLTISDSDVVPSVIHSFVRNEKGELYFHALAIVRARLNYGENFIQAHAVNTVYSSWGALPDDRLPAGEVGAPRIPDYEVYYQNAWGSCEIFRVAGEASVPVSYVGLAAPSAGDPGTRFTVMFGDDVGWCRPSPRGPDTWVRILVPKTHEERTVQPLTIELRLSSILEVTLQDWAWDVIAFQFRCSGGGQHYGSGTFLRWEKQRLSPPS